MNIDSDTLSRYKTDKSEFSTVLRKGINFRKSRFKSNKLGRCAFLNDKNLCDIIINLGENSLCQVCRDHPRFRSFFNDRTETGLGFCCEQATRIILTYPDKIQAILASDDGASAQPDFNQTNILQFREKVLNIIQDRQNPIDQRIQTLLKECRFDRTGFDFKSFIKRLLSLEKADKNWAKTLKQLQNVNPEQLSTKTDPDNQLVAEQFIVNGIFRHLSDAEDTLWVRARTVSIILAWWLVLNISKHTKTDIFDVVRAYSVEIEYSQKNLNKLYDYSYKLIKI